MLQLLKLIKPILPVFTNNLFLLTDVIYRRIKLGALFGINGCYKVVSLRLNNVFISLTSGLLGASHHTLQLQNSLTLFNNWADCLLSS